MKQGFNKKECNNKWYRVSDLMRDYLWFDIDKIIVDNGTYGKEIASGELLDYINCWGQFIYNPHNNTLNYYIDNRN